MSFTDEDLKRTKEELPKGIKEYGFDSMYSFSVDDLSALLARLEAAEECADYLFKSHGLCCSDCVESVTKWRKACGK